MGQEIVGNSHSLRAQLPRGTVEIDRAPVNDGGGDEAQARCAETLIFEGAVSNFALTVKEHRAPRRKGRHADAAGRRRRGPAVSVSRW
jgi:hypothetical protein